jgi:hypothetical protein
MATTIAPGFGAYTALSDPGAGSTAPVAGVAEGSTVADGGPLGGAADEGAGDALEASQAAATTSARMAAAKRCQAGIGSSMPQVARGVTG